jgi:regulator of replication initiation timing
MSAIDTAKEVLRMASTAGIAKEVIELMEKKLALLTQQVAALDSENGRLKMENAHLRAQMEHLQPAAHGLTDEQLAILKVLESVDRNFTPEEVAARVGAKRERTHYLLTKLRSAKYVYEVPVGFHIEDKGREALHGPV